MKKKEHVDETWLIPYSDMLTLLLALFIVMFAMSKVDTEKLAKASQEFNIIFKAGSNVVQTGGSGGASVGKSGVSIVSSDSVTEDIKIKEIKSKLEKGIKKSGYQFRLMVSICLNFTILQRSVEQKNSRVEIAIVRKYPSPPVTKEIDKDKNKK
ncbi:chemotaxis protein MotB [Clostridium botulinum B str. Osaka05]|uniref:Chemotaxis protein MotB n=1 Tax=Clostridium botulinum B str. Osaka05 TaxID=1407017 RepID=A0A0S6U6F2_CLOBO|nr:flagellar motor protein MotB [Clostridium botulinum]GAE02756.1 chemotaxis protein MotB [Clostridium botulinum B str. Osaka05]